MAAVNIRDSTVGYQVPSKLKYSQALPLAVPSQNFTELFTPTNGSTFQPNGIVRIPISADAFLSPMESYLQFTITNKSRQLATAAPNVDINVRLDHSCQSFLQRVRVLAPNGAPIDDIVDYNVLSALMSDFQHDPEWRSTDGHTTSGYSQTMSDGVDGIYALPDYDGHTMRLGVAGVAQHATFTMHIIGTLLSQNKMLPLKYMNTGVILELTLAPAIDALISRGANSQADNVLNYEMSDISYVGRILRFDQLFYSAFEQLLLAGAQTGQPAVQIHSPSYHHFSGTGRAGTQFNLAIGENAASIKSMFAVFREQLNVQSATASRIGARTRDHIGEYQFRIGSKMYPNTPVRISAQNSGSSYSELKKALGTMHSIDDGGTVVRRKHYLLNASVNAGLTAGLPLIYDTAVGARDAVVARLVAATFLRVVEAPYYGKFAIGYDYESFSGSLPYQSGLDASIHALNVELICRREGAENGLDVRADVFSLIDQVVSIDANQNVMVTR